MNPAKYPSTPYLDLTNFPLIGKQVIVTEKMDGENTSMYRHRIHARSIDSLPHPSRDWVKAFHANIKHSIPENIKICGENVYAQHSIKYDRLSSYFLGFAVHDAENCWAWDKTIELFSEIGVTSVPVIWQGILDRQIIDRLIFAVDTDKSEGLVFRNFDEFKLNEFADNVVKWVRPGHVQANEHWMHQEIKPNLLCNNRSL